MRTEIRISGFGGQGVILAGIVLGNAASLHDGLNAVQTQTYGPQARGGACNSNVIIGDEEIRYPRIINSDYLLAMSQIAFDKFKRKISDSGGMILYDPDLVVINDEDVAYFKSNNINFIDVNALKLAEGVGRKIVANMVMLGAFSKISDLVKIESLEKSIGDILPREKIEMNISALRTGYDAVGAEG